MRAARVLVMLAARALVLRLQGLAVRAARALVLLVARELVLLRLAAVGAAGGAEVFSFQWRS